MGAAEVIGGIVTLVIIVVIIWKVLSTPTKTSDAVDLVNGSISGKELKTATGVTIPRSFNQKQGATFTYTGWILANDFTYNYGNRRLIFTKGDCPGLYLDTTSNSLLITVNTYADTPETILISNIPANKWVHFAIVVDQDSVDIYINGVIRQHHSLSQLPKQNDENVTMGATAASGWDGVLSKLQYTPRSMTSDEIGALTASVPTDDLRAHPSGPQYFDLSWYTGRT